MLAVARLARAAAFGRRGGHVLQLVRFAHPPKGPGGAPLPPAAAAPPPVKAGPSAPSTNVAKDAKSALVLPATPENLLALRRARMDAVGHVKSEMPASEKARDWLHNLIGAITFVLLFLLFRIALGEEQDLHMKLVQLTAELRRLRSTAKKALMSVNTHKGSVPAGFGKNINFYVSGPLDADIMILLHAEDGDNPVLWGLVQQSIINELRKRMGLPPTTVDDIAAALAKEAEAAATATAAGSGAGAAAAAAPAAKPGARLSLAKELGIDLSDAPPLLASLFAEHDALAVVSKDVTIAAMHPFERLQLLDDDIAKFRSTLASLAQATDIATAQELAEAWEKTTSRRRAAAATAASGDQPQYHAPAREQLRQKAMAADMPAIWRALHHIETIRQQGKDKGLDDELLDLAKKGAAIVAQMRPDEVPAAVAAVAAMDDPAGGALAAPAGALPAVPRIAVVSFHRGGIRFRRGKSTSPSVRSDDVDILVAELERLRDEARGSPGAVKPSGASGDPVASALLPYHQQRHAASPAAPADGRRYVLVSHGDGAWGNIRHAAEQTDKVLASVAVTPVLTHRSKSTAWWDAVNVASRAPTPQKGEANLLQTLLDPPVAEITAYLPAGSRDVGSENARRALEASNNHQIAKVVGAAKKDTKAGEPDEALLLEAEAERTEWSKEPVFGDIEMGILLDYSEPHVPAGEATTTSASSGARASAGSAASPLPPLTVVGIAPSALPACISADLRLSTTLWLLQGYNACSLLRVSNTVRRQVLQARIDASLDVAVELSDGTILDYLPAMEAQIAKQKAAAATAAVVAASDAAAGGAGAATSCAPQPDAPNSVWINELISNAKYRNPIENVEHPSCLVFPALPPSFQAAMGTLGAEELQKLKAGHALHKIGLAIEHASYGLLAKSRPSLEKSFVYLLMEQEAQRLKALARTTTVLIGAGEGPAAAPLGLAILPLQRPETIAKTILQQCGVGAPAAAAAGSRGYQLA